MKRLVARFEDVADADEARAALREAGLVPDRRDIETPFFDPGASMPEARGLLWGALLGGIVGLALFYAIEVDLLWIPRFSPMMSAGEYAVPFLGLGLGVAIGGFVGGVVGSLRPVPEPSGVAVAVLAPDDRVGEIRGLLHDRGATDVRGRVVYHESPQEAARAD